MKATLKIGGHTITVLQKEIEGCGETDLQNNTITIDSRLPRSQKESTLIHEIIHNMNSTLDDSELGHALIDSLAEQLHQVLFENHLADFSPIIGRED